MTPERFDEFFRALYGYDPFPWQAKLARRVARARTGEAAWPQALALPTASGKTACIDIAVFALACQADRQPGERTAARRIFFTVDRRVIVDQAYERAMVIRRRLLDAEDGILRAVADRLRTLAAGDEPLACYELRGGIYRDDAWARSPLQPTVVTTTVDQIGSRLLFRGYGLRSGSMRPVHAGLTANDSLIILDEAHCSNPFRQTLDAMRHYRAGAGHDRHAASADAPFHVVFATATPPLDVEDVLLLGDEDPKHEVLGARIRASKPAQLVLAGDAKGEHAQEKLADRLARLAQDLVSDQCRAIGVMVNRVATARLVFQRLSATDVDAILLTGRMRPIDRDEVMAAWQGRLAPTRGERKFARPVFVIATQCLEVGADLDFDGLVTECASLDALRQRFGRLNRAGRAVPAPGMIVVRADQADPKEHEPDPVYGEALARTWAWLNANASADGGNRALDLGVIALDRLLPSEPGQRDDLLRALQAPAPDAPVMLPAHVDCWAQTSPVPLPDPDVAVFLHGAGRGAPDVQVCWRADLTPQPERPLRAVTEEWAEIVSQCPPASPECMPVPLYVLRRWLRGEGAKAGRDETDVEGGVAAERGDGNGSRVLRWLGPDESEAVEDPAALRPGDTVVIPAALGGWDVFGHIPPGPAGTPVPDLGDRSNFLARGIPVLRLHEPVMASWPDCEAHAALLGIARAGEPPEDSDGIRELNRWLRELAQAADAPEHVWLRRAAETLAGDRRVEVTVHPAGGLVLRGKRRPPGLATWSASLTSEDDSSSATVDVGLTEHLRGVQTWARRFAEGAGLPAPLVEDLALAALLHDPGKADPRFQALLQGGNPWAAQAAGRLLAKSSSLPGTHRERERARQESGYPRGSRHELLSIRLAECAPALLERAHDPELVLHLIASHHGRCRPFAPVIVDPRPVFVATEIAGRHLGASTATGLERLDSGIAERFWRLVRRYGWWHLAWLEAIFRLADHRCSEAEQDARLNEPSADFRSEET